MNAYLKRIVRHLVREHGLRRRHDSADERVWVARRFGFLEGNRCNGHKTVTETRLCHMKSADYLDFQVRSLVRPYRKGRPGRETLAAIRLHITANATGSIRRIYIHDEGEHVRGVRTLSLKNYYIAQDEKFARLLMVNEERLAWIRELPLGYYPIANKDLRTIDSMEAFLQHFAGPGVVIPKRILQVLGPSETVLLLRAVPPNHLNDIATAMKRHATDLHRHPSANRAVLAYYKGALGVECPQFATVYSYLCCCRHFGRKANMRLRSGRRLIAERDAMRRERTLQQVVDICTHPEYVLEKLDHGGIQLELIDTGKRLWQEAQQMESCVDTYCHDINDGRCAIYHVQYRGGDYTLEIGRREDRNLYVVQLKGVRNSDPPPGLRRRINAIIGKRPNQ